MYAIETQRLTKFYGKTPVVHALDLKVPTGTVYGFLGRNGAGKSTTMKMLLGMVIPDYGSSTVLGEDSQKLSPAARERIAYMAEGNPYYRWMTIKNAMNFTRPFYSKWNQDLFDMILDHFGLSLKSKIRKLSNGQRAQVALALAIATEPEVLILDDPTLGLDSVVRRDFLESMIQIIQHQGRTILFSSHNLGDVERVADRIGILVDGVLRVDCPTDHFRDAVRKVVLEFPGTPPPFPVCRGLVNVWSVGHRLEIVLVNMDEEHRQIIASLRPIATDIVELNLEEAFIEYTRGSRRSLPMFTGDEKDVPEPDRERVA